MNQLLQLRKVLCLHTHRTRGWAEGVRAANPVLVSLVLAAPSPAGKDRLQNDPENIKAHFKYKKKQQTLTLLTCINQPTGADRTGGSSSVQAPCRLLGSGWRVRISSGQSCSLAASPHCCTSQGASLIILPRGGCLPAHLGKTYIGQHAALLSTIIARGPEQGAQGFAQGFALKTSPWIKKKANRGFSSDMKVCI